MTCKKEMNQPNLKKKVIHWVVPLPRMPVITRIIVFLVGDPYKPSFATVTGGGQPKSSIFGWFQPSVFWGAFFTHPWVSFEKDADLEEVIPFNNMLFLDVSMPNFIHDRYEISNRGVKGCWARAPRPDTRLTEQLSMAHQNHLRTSS